MIAVPLPLLVLPWLLAVAVWAAFPWLARRVGHARVLRWLPPSLVLAGGALLWLAAASSDADGHDDATANLLAAADSLCVARAALPSDVDAASQAFQNRAHDGLHELAAHPGLDRALAAELLRSKEAVESRLASGVDGAELVAPMEALVGSTLAALGGIGIEAEPCAG